MRNDKMPDLFDLFKKLLVTKVNYTQWLDYFPCEVQIIKQEFSDDIIVPGVFTSQDPAAAGNCGEVYIKTPFGNYREFAMQFRQWLKEHYLERVGIFDCAMGEWMLERD